MWFTSRQIGVQLGIVGIATKLSGLVRTCVGPRSALKKRQHLQWKGMCLVFPNSSQKEDLSGANVSARGLFSRAATAFLGSVLYIGLIPNMEGDKVW